MTFEQSQCILRAILASRLEDEREDLLSSAIRYARIRTDWQVCSVEERRALDDERSRAHSVLIDSCNILSRSMASSGEDIAWRQILGDDRRVIGDFACHVHCFLGLMAR